MMKFLLAFLLPPVALFGQTPEISYDSAPDFLKLPEHIYLGEAAGVATTSKGNIVVYTRTGAAATLGASRSFTHGGSRLFEFDASGKYLREIGHGVYGFLFAQAVRVDPQDNIWIVDRGSNMVIKFDPAGRILMTLSRKPESVNLAVAPKPAPAGGGRGVPGDNFVQPTDVAWDAAGNIFVSDGYGNARIVKLDKNGKYLKSWGSKGADPGQFDIPHSLAVDAQGNVYVADLGNKRIQVFDNEGTPRRAIENVGVPRAICISPGPHPFLYSADSDSGQITKMELDAKVQGKFGETGKLLKEFGIVNEIDCRIPNTLYVGELANWRVQKLNLH
jgi:NHL repeat